MLYKIFICLSIINFISSDGWCSSKDLYNEKNSDEKIPLYDEGGFMKFTWGKGYKPQASSISDVEDKLKKLSLGDSSYSDIDNHNGTNSNSGSCIDGICSTS